MRAAGLASFGAVHARVAQRGEHFVTMTIEQTDAQAEPGTDLALLNKNWATATALSAPCQSGAVDLSSLCDR